MKKWKKIRQRFNFVYDAPAYLKSMIIHTFFDKCIGKILFYKKEISLVIHGDVAQ